ncbi:MAG: 2-amino-4-hydroxy-6-hydroxymethyldihydropteridine diphosphokinase [Phycisphaerales bacterium]|nr:MAG: 2-amino-4-hydroxy-6-hydroxymethyldihydropteridine diphosphokinase [Phycisphaerales bacterium]
MAKQTTAYVGLGSNLGDRDLAIRTALKMLAEADQIELACASDIIETGPLGQADQPQYLNAVAKVGTTLDVESLYEALADTEGRLGRRRDGKWTSRPIDLDLLLFGQEVIDLPHLTVPHRQMHVRSFVLVGLCQLTPDLLHPTIKVSVRELAGRLAGRDFVLDPHRPQLISVAGIIGAGKTTLARKLASALGCQMLAEPYDENPFLPQVYAGRKELALESQLFFLNGRVRQLNGSTFARGRVAITDYVFDKEFVYARRLLDPQQLASYQRRFAHLAAGVPSPVLVIYIQDSPRHCLNRIHKRNRPYEQVIGLPFLEALDSDYEQLFADWKACPVIRIETSDLDYADEASIDRLASQIRHYVATAP